MHTKLTHAGRWFATGHDYVAVSGNAVSVLDLEQNRLAADAADHPHADDHLF